MRNRHRQGVRSCHAAFSNGSAVTEGARHTGSSNTVKQSTSKKSSSWWPLFTEYKTSEQIILRSARRISAIYSAVPFQPSNMDQMRMEIIDAVGSGLSASLAIREGQSAAEQLEMILRTFCCAGYRPLRLRPICEHRVSPDERFLLSFIAGCQRKDMCNIRNILSWLAPGVSAPHLILPGQNLAGILKNSGIVLPQRLYLGSSPSQSFPILSVHEQASKYH